MLLKNYQQAALEKLERFLNECRLFDAKTAFEAVAPEDDNPYAKADYIPPQGIADCPHVCLRLPTGGGKTILAARAIAKVALFQQRKYPVVLWMTPSDIIRKQTVEALKNPAHPYREAMDNDFRRRVQVWDISECFQIRPQDMIDCVCVVVTTIQALRIKSTEGRKVYAHNEYFAPHFRRFPHRGLDLEKRDNGKVKFSFVNLLHIRRPLVIVDEAHNAVTGLSAELHRRLRPSCIIEFTATPRDKQGKPMHNVLVNVSATALRDEEMIKLPIELTEHRTWQDAVNGAVATRKRLAETARNEKEHIRPVVLYQAQAQTQTQSVTVTVAALKKHLINNEKIPKEKIAVATGEQRELDNININDPQCPVEHVITVQALKEGWDCPFAYVLCTVANVQSATHVEQLLGRVMRMPFAQRRAHKELNRAYAHVPETQFSHAAHALRDKLVTEMGFEEDAASEAVQQILPGASEGSGALLEPLPEEITAASEPDFSTCTEEERKVVERAVEVRREADGTTRVIVKDVIPLAVHEAIAATVTDPDEREKVRHYLQVKNMAFQKYQSPARRGKKFTALPQLFFIFDERELEATPDNIVSVMQWDVLEQDYLLDRHEFTIEETATSFKIDFSGDQTAELKIAEGGQWELPELSGKPEQWSETQLALWLENEIRTGYLKQEVVAEFARRNVNALIARDQSLEMLNRFKYLLARQLNEKLEKLRAEATNNNYQQVLFADPAPVCKFEFEFAPDPLHYEYNHVYRGGYDFQKHYYGVVGDLKNEGEEYDCAVALDRIADVRYWIRNVDRKGNSFKLPLAHGNFYPDFVAELIGGRVLVVEYKGADRVDNLDSQSKKLIGELWERKSKGKALFVMPSQQQDGPSVRQQIMDKL